MSRMLLAAGRYVQGAKALREIGTHAARFAVTPPMVEAAIITADALGTAYRRSPR